ncbi:MAG: hypothetical protein P8Y07_08575, partial [Gemmatimonadales bacterium]
AMPRLCLSRALLSAALLVALSAVSACTEGDDKLAETTTADGDEVGDAGLEGSTARDLTDLNVCELLPERDVIELLGGEAKTAASRSDYGNSQGCDYGIGDPGTATYEYISLWVSTPDLFLDAESILKTDRGLGQDASAEDLKGLGDVAFAIHNQTEQQTTVHVLRRGDVAISATAEGLEHARQLAETILERLGNP